MPDITATVNSKGLDKTGFDDDLIASLFRAKVGKHMLALVELQVVDKRGPNIKGRSKVELAITQIDPVTDENLDEHLREIQRTLAYNRGLDGHTGTTTQGQEPTVDQVLAAGAKHRPHPFLPVDASDENPICDVCGLLEAAGVHSIQETLDQPDDPENPSEPALDVSGEDEVNAEEDEQATRGDADPWEYDGPEGTKPAADTVPDPFTTPEPATT